MTERFICHAIIIIILYYAQDRHVYLPTITVYTWVLSSSSFFPTLRPNNSITLSYYLSIRRYRSLTWTRSVWVYDDNNDDTYYIIQTTYYSVTITYGGEPK